MPTSIGVVEHIRRPASIAGALMLWLVLPATASVAAPDFASVSWRPLGCPTEDLVAPATPAAASFAGDHANLPAYYAYDAGYLYFRYRMDADPASGGGFAQYSWTALLQVPGVDPFRYQYQLSLNGKSDTMEIWRNEPAEEVKFPHFQDSSEVQLDSVAVGSFARTVAAGSSYNGSPDWFVDFAFPVSTLVAKGVIDSADDLARVLFFPATSTNPNNFNKSFMNCPFQPVAGLQFSKTVTPTVAPTDEVTPLTYTIDVQNPGLTPATGVVVEDLPFPSFLGNVAVQATTDDPNATVTVVSTNPLLVTSSVLGSGRRLLVVITADAAPSGCGVKDFVNTASGRATNTLELRDSATIGAEACDGADNDCDGQVDEGTSLCDDNDACTVDSCGPTGCVHDPIPGCGSCVTPADCADGDACTVDSCSAGVCTYAPSPTCTVGCTTAADCTDHDLCTIDLCIGGICSSRPSASCAPCTDADCEDANPCTDDVCGDSGSCELTGPTNCPSCTAAADCDDSNACTTDVCTDGVCEAQPIDGCAVPPGRGPGTDRPGGSDPTTPVVEVCGDCQDNDADGLVDYDDPDCCERTVPLTLSRMMMRTRPEANRDGFRLRSRPSGVGMTRLDPARDRVALQVSDGAGALYCQTLPLVATKRGLTRGLLSFSDRTGTRAGGLQRARLKIRSDGRAVFRATGGKMELRTPADGGTRVTVHAGGQCLQADALLRTKPAKAGTRNVYP